MKPIIFKVVDKISTDKCANKISSVKCDDKCVKNHDKLKNIKTKWIVYK